MPNQIHCHRSPRSLWLALTLSVWLDTALRLDYVTAFSNNAVSGFCSSAPQSRRCRRTGKLQHPSRRCNKSSNSLLSLTKQSAAAVADHRHIRLFQLCMSTKDHHDKIITDGEPETSTTTEEQLQTRFEEAMQRRKERRAQKDSSSDPAGEAFVVDEATSTSSKNKEIETTSETNEVIENDARTNIGAETSEPNETPEKDVKSNIHEESVSKDKTTYLENEEVKSTTRRFEEKPGMANENDNNFVQENARRPSPKTVRPTRKDARKDEIDERKTSGNYYDDDYENRYSRDEPTNDDYNDDINYNDYDQGYSSRSAPTCEWETYRSTSILFPPLAQTNNDGTPTRPKAIIHFVGGTFFGSYPRKFYGSLLEDIACKCDAVVVATPIPLVLPGKGLVSKLGNWISDEGGSEEDWNRGQGPRRRSSSESTNPLDHLSLAETIQKEFNNAYRDVVLDEYCSDYMNEKEVEDFMKHVPIVGIGHSLGARIQAISCTHPRISKRFLSMGKGNRLIRSGREGMIYLGFANWGASSSIPGLETLDRAAKKRKQGRRDKDRGGVGRRDDVWDERSPRRRRGSGDDNDGRKRDSRYDRYDAEDLDLVDVFSDVVTSVAKGAKQIGEALTPEAEDLEFSPTPNELWDDLSSADGWYSQSCLNNLIVQFDEDPIDQGSRLARTLLTAYDAELNSTNAVDEDANQLHDVKFARLPGGHLTPVTLQEGIAKLLPRGAVSLLSSSYNFILQQLDDERMGKSSQKQRRQVKDVADTVASYIKSLNSDE